MKLLIESDLKKDALEAKLEEMALGDKNSAESDEPKGSDVGVFRKGDEKMFWIRNGRKRFAWILTCEDGAIRGKTEYTLSHVAALFRLGFYAMGLIFMLALIGYEAMQRQGGGVFFSVAVGLIPLWLFTIGLVLNVIMPKRLAKGYIERRLTGEKQETADKEKEEIATEESKESAE